MRNHPSSPLPHTLLLTLLTLLILALFSRGLTDPDTGWPDADRVLMDGLFIHDFLRDLNLSTLLDRDFFSNAYQYAIRYFAQYPALSLGSRPPFFPGIEAIFFFVFGIHDHSAKLALLLFVLIGLWAWHDLVRRTHDRTTALMASGLLFTTPFIVQWGWYPMLEIPVLAMTILTANLLWRHQENGAPKWLYLAAVAFSLALWTKQTALFMAPWFAAWLIVTGQARRLLKTRATWLALGMMAVLTAPLAALTIWMGKTNLALAFQGMEAAHQNADWTQWAYLRQYLDLLIQYQVTYPVLALAALGVVTTLVRRDRHALFYLLLIVTTYLFFTALHSFRIDRYTIFWVPGFALLAALPFHHFREHPLVRRFGWLVVVGIMIMHIHQVQTQTPAYTQGHREAAILALQHSKQGRIFMDGINNGYFTYYVRLNDPDRRFHVLRGDKLLHSSSVFTEHWTQIHIRDLQGIHALFDQYGIDIIVVEGFNYAGLEIHQILRDYLETDAFELLKEIPIRSTRSRLSDQVLKVYRYKHPQPPTNRRISLSVPLVGKTFETTLPDTPAPQTPKRDSDLRTSHGSLTSPPE
ncbi:MAG: glycosyltransferase family 39 protein [Magnetococcales bacterium]|nr:glycosyltransferase family 39 protein [Magnetococcales bacterium]